MSKFNIQYEKNTTRLLAQSKWCRVFRYVVQTLYNDIMPQLNIKIKNLLLSEVKYHDKRFN